MNDDDNDAALAQLQLEERRRQEDEALARCTHLTEEFKRECAEFHRETEAWLARMREREIASACGNNPPF